MHDPTSVILLAEDEEDDVFLIKRAFQKSLVANPVVRVRDGEEALAYLKGEGKFADRQEFPFPGFVLLDLKMPRRSGFELIEWVRSDPLLKRLPLVVLTSSKDNPDINRAYALGANTYLVKPVEFEGLIEMLRTLNCYWCMLAEKPSFPELA